MEEIERYVEECYQRVLRRPADKGGLYVYANAILNGHIIAEKLPNILKSSEEFRKRFPEEFEWRHPLIVSISQPIKYEVHQLDKAKKGSDLVSIIVLEYNTLEILKTCIESILKNTELPYELIVVDNASNDGSVAWAMNKSGIHMVIQNQHNYGWTRANNVGMKVAHGNYFLLLNSDVEVRHRDWLKNMVACARDPQVGTVGAKLLYPDGKIQHIGGGIKHGNPYHPYNHSPSNIPQANKSRVVPYCTGACLLIKKTTLENAGYLNEQFQFGFGDVDYGLQVIMSGLKNVYCPNAVLTHHWAYTQRKFKAFISHEMLQLYKDKWLKKLPEIEKRVELTW